jgi:phosphoribosylaminoimidazole-succinocarboxamide synthase
LSHNNWGKEMVERKEQIYEGKSKTLYATGDKDKVIVYFRDDATAGDGLRKGVIKGKGEINCTFCSIIYQKLERHGIPTHFIKQVSSNEQLCWKLDILPIEIIVRNIVAGHLASHLGIAEGTPLKHAVLEQDYKNDALHDPMINLWHILAFGWATKAQYNRMNEMALKTNNFLKKFFDKRGIILVDFKLEFGKKGNKILLADEITPDGCRLWDKATRKRLDKDRFRRNLGGIEEAYQEVLARIQN